MPGGNQFSFKGGPFKGLLKPIFKVILEGNFRNLGGYQGLNLAIKAYRGY